jgi:hypothetical protein
MVTMRALPPPGSSLTNTSARSAPSGPWAGMTARTVTAMVPDGELGSAEASRCSHDFVTSGVTTAIHRPKVSPTLQL